jgi:hypothetical protein
MRVAILPLNAYRHTDSRKLFTGWEDRRESRFRRAVAHPVDRRARGRYRAARGHTRMFLLAAPHESTQWPL